MKVGSTRTVQTTIRTVFRAADVANLLYEQLPLTERLPGSPLLTVELTTYGFVLTQTHEASEALMQKETI